ncbi:hypothetical protein DFH08DRAFT_802029 [Mycena albidolilacea]|uniref:Uncharacterized protein n=1 Tax=Mycena albidolilacea TaxID=1033008 RepID=A0AAD7AGL2_9AGAR|nr:hypothetical protein DFH08DRAFT_802029 [Mycena albidolilacea]
MTDHAADQKKLRALFLEMKECLDREIRGERVLLHLTAPKLLDVIYEITDHKIQATGGMAAWDALPTEESNLRNSTLHTELCQKFGQAEFEKLSQEERNEAHFFHCGDCFMHKDLNVHRDNAAAAISGSAVAKKRAETESSRGGVKLCELKGLLLLNNKDNKKGQQDSHGQYPLYGCFSEAAAEIIVNLTVYRELMQFIRDRKMSLAYTNLEKNIWDAINDLRTIVELVVLLWYGQSFSKPVKRVVRSRTSTGGLPNLWDMGPVLEGVITHCERVIADPDIIMSPNLSYETASMDGRPWERPEAMYTAHALLPTLPRNEARVAQRRAPNARLEFSNAKSQYKHNDTAGFIAEKLNTPAEQQFLRKRAEEMSSEGRHQKRKVAQAEHDQQTAREHHEKKTKSDRKKATEIAEINKCVPVFDIARFTDPEMLKEILIPQLDLQLKWHRLRELEMDKKTEIPPLSKLKKQQKAELIVAAVGRWRRRVDTGEVPLMGFQSSEPLEEDRLVVEPDNEEDDAGYGDRE